MLKKFRLRRTYSFIRLHFRFQKKITRPSRAKAYANIRWLGSSRASPKSFEKTSRANQNELACPPLARVPVVAQACSRRTLQNAVYIYQEISETDLKNNLAVVGSDCAPILTEPHLGYTRNLEVLFKRPLQWFATFE